MTKQMTGAGRRAAAAVALTVAVASAAAGCGGGPFQSGAPTPLSSEGATTPPQPDLAPFYSQQLQWEDCGQAKCTWLKVPVDYAKPAGETMRLRLLRVPARGDARGALFVNPGGPGGSATEYAAAASLIVSGKVRDAYDVVGLDPRGVGQSNPITCIDDVQMDEMMGADPTPADAAARAAADRIAKNFADACQKKYPTLLPHVSTLDAAKDMDVARAALGQPKMLYLGKSYGTYLGAIYADQFPTKIGRAVLDGVMAPDLTDEELSLGQAKGFETASRAYVEDCVKRDGCPVGRDLDSGMKYLQRLMQKLSDAPVPVKGDTRITQLTEGWASLGIANAMYSEGKWPDLTRALSSVNAGDGTDLFRLATDYVSRTDGHYSGNIMQVINAVNCLDHPVLRLTEQQRVDQLKKFTEVAPTWGPFMSGSSSICLNWPAPPNAQPKKVTADGADPILVVGTIRDPATPYEWAPRLANQLKKGRLVTWDGDGHTAYMRQSGSRCVQDAVDNYLVDGTVPDAEVKCGR